VIANNLKRQPLRHRHRMFQKTWKAQLRCSWCKSFRLQLLLPTMKLPKIYHKMMELDLLQMLITPIKMMMTMMMIWWKIVKTIIWHKAPVE